jgi:hypothetical protein
MPKKNFKKRALTGGTEQFENFYNTLLKGKLYENLYSILQGLLYILIILDQDVIGGILIKLCNAPNLMNKSIDITNLIIDAMNKDTTLNANNFKDNILNNIKYIHGDHLYNIIQSVLEYFGNEKNVQSMVSIINYINSHPTLIESLLFYFEIFISVQFDDLSAQINNKLKKGGGPLKWFKKLFNRKNKRDEIYRTDLELSPVDQLPIQSIKSFKSTNSLKTTNSPSRLTSQKSITTNNVVKSYINKYAIDENIKTFISNFIKVIFRIIYQIDVQNNNQKLQDVIFNVDSHIKEYKKFINLIKMLIYIHILNLIIDLQNANEYINTVKNLDNVCMNSQKSGEDLKLRYAWLKDTLNENVAFIDELITNVNKDNNPELIIGIVRNYVIPHIQSKSNSTKGGVSLDNNMFKSVQKEIQRFTNYTSLFAFVFNQILKSSQHTKTINSIAINLNKIDNLNQQYIKDYYSYLRQNIDNLDKLLIDNYVDIIRRKLNNSNDSQLTVANVDLIFNQDCHTNKTRTIRTKKGVSVLHNTRKRN